MDDEGVPKGVKRGEREIDINAMKADYMNIYGALLSHRKKTRNIFYDLT